MLQRPSTSLWWGRMAPWREMERMRREMDRLLTGWPTGFWRSVVPSYPHMNVWMNEDGAIVAAELPGVSPEDIDISVLNDTLTLKGCRQPHELAEGETTHRRERGCGTFIRTLQLPFQVAAEGIEASFEKGVLHVALPRAEADKPKKITVKAS